MDYLCVSFVGGDLRYGTKKQKTRRRKAYVTNEILCQAEVVKVSGGSYGEILLCGREPAPQGRTFHWHHASSQDTGPVEDATCRMWWLLHEQICMVCVRKRVLRTALNIKNILKISMNASVVQWSEFLATDPEARVLFPALSDSLRSSGSGTGSTQPREYN
jgi:hypothetical protein